jgi:hypothetical protein
MAEDDGDRPDCGHRGHEPECSISASALIPPIDVAADQKIGENNNY